MHKRIGLLSLFLISFTASANVWDEDTGNKFRVLGAVDFKFDNIEGLDGSVFTFGAGLEGIYHFSPFVGVFTGALYNPLKDEDSGLKTEVDYLDIPLGLSFDYNPTAMEGMKNILNLGLYWGLAISDVEINGVKVADGEDVFGLILENYTLFPVTPGLKIGLHVYAKYGFSEITEGKDDTYFSTAIGLGAQFL